MAANSRLAVATHILLDLALHPDTWTQSNTLAQSINTHAVVVRRLLGDLKRQGLVESRNGKAGGARLARPPKEISMWEVYLAVQDANLFGHNPNPANKKCPLSCAMKEVLEPVFSTTQQLVHDNLAAVSLQDLLGRMPAASLHP